MQKKQIKNIKIQQLQLNKQKNQKQHNKTTALPKGRRTVSFAQV